MNDEQLKRIIEEVLVTMKEKEGAVPQKAPVEEIRKAPQGTMVEDDVIPDILLDDYTSYLDFDNPVNGPEFIRIKKKTDARMGLGRCGPRYRTKAYLRMLMDHAGAYDAALSEAPEEVAKELQMLMVKTLCTDKDEYLSRPDLGKMFDEDTKKMILDHCVKNPDVQILLSEGLSSTAMEQNTASVYQALTQGLKFEGLSVGTPIYVKYSRVPAMDVITELLNPKVTIMLIGERPGLSTFASMSAYLSYKGKVGMPESLRNVVSNIHENGINPSEAGAHLASVVKKMMEQKISGTEFKMV